MRQADVYLLGRLAGRLTEDENGYEFQYDLQYLNNAPVRLSVTLPLQVDAFHDRVLFPFFDGLIPDELSPAYDLLPVRIIMPTDREELALTLNGKKTI